MVDVQGSNDTRNGSPSTKHHRAFEASYLHDESVDESSSGSPRSRGHAGLWTKDADDFSEPFGALTDESKSAEVDQAAIDDLSLHMGNIKRNSLSTESGLGGSSSRSMWSNVERGLSMVKKTATEIQRTTRPIQRVTSGFVQKILLETGKSLGLEIEIDDPALKELFTAVLATDRTLRELYILVSAFWQSIETMADSSIENFAEAATTEDETPGSARLNKVVSQYKSKFNSCFTTTEDNQSFHTLKELKEHVLGVIEEQMKQHDQLRDRFRERQTLKSNVESLRRETVSAKKTKWELTRKRSEGADEKLGSYQSRLKDVESGLLETLMDLRERRAEIISKPWDNFRRIQADYYDRISKALYAVQFVD